MKHPEKMRQRRETVEHPFGTIKARMGATHFLMKTLPRVASEMALHVLAYNLTRVMNHRHSATHHSDEGIVSIRKINALTNFDDLVSPLPGRFYTTKTHCVISLGCRIWSLLEV